MHVFGEGTGEETSTTEVTHMRKGKNKCITTPFSLCISMRIFELLGTTLERLFEGCSWELTGFKTAHRGPISVKHQPILINNRARYTIEKTYTAMHVYSEAMRDETSSADVISMEKSMNKGIPIPVSLCFCMRMFVLVVSTIKTSLEGCLRESIRSKTGHGRPMHADHQPISSITT